MGREAGDRLSGFARGLLGEWRRLECARAGGRLVVAVSGGADSTALLLGLEELTRRGLLTPKVLVAHLDHGLRGEDGAEDARRVEGVARELGCEVECGRARVAERARSTGDNLEQSARRERYEFLSRVARKFDACAVATGHTLDDQAETVLLALLRGSGAEGLGGMRPVRPLGEGGRARAAEGGESGEKGRPGDERERGGVLLVRPLLGWARRAETLAYCAARGVEVASDEMNEDERFARVRVRRRLLPLLETFNPRAVEAIARAAVLLREDAAALETEAAELLSRASDESAAGQTGAAGKFPAWPLRVEVLAAAPAALRGRTLRQWLARGRGDLRRLELVHVRAVEKLLAGGRGGRVAELPGGCRVERRRRWLFFRDAESAGEGV